MFQWKKKREREKSDCLDDLLLTHTPIEEQSPIPLPTTTDLQKKDNENTESKELPTPESEGATVERKQRGSNIDVTPSPRERPSPRIPHRQPHLPEDRSHHTEESGITETHRPRVGSSASSISAASSYHTAFSSHDASALQITGTETEKEVVRLVSSMKDELLHSMNTMQERMTKLEGRIETIEHKLDSSVENMENKLETSMEEVEKKIQCVQSEMQNTQSVVANSEGNADKGSCHGLPILPEVNEERDAGGNKAENSTHLQQVSKKVSIAFRRFTDSEAAKVAHHRQNMRRRKYAEKKSISVQDSRLQLPQKECSQEVIMWLTQKVMHWKFIARWLGLQEPDVERIMTDHPQDDREQCYKMFMRWRCMDPENFTYPVLGEALRRESQKLFNDYVDEVHRVENKIDIPDHD